MELRHLRYFVAVAEELNFGRAAERLRISQPPLSQQIRKLEDELGVRLFYRTKRRVELTEVGGLFLAEARKTLRQAEGAARVARRAGRGELGSLSLGFVGSAAYGVLPELLRGFRGEYPGVRLELRTMTTLEQAEALENGEIGLGVLRPPVEGDLKLLPVADEPLVAVLPEGHPLAARRTVPLAALAGEDFVLWPRRSGSAVYDRILGLCAGAGFSPRVAQESEEHQVIMGLVAARLGVSLMIGDPGLFSGRGVVFREVRDPRWSWGLALAHRRREGSPVVRAFVELARRTATSTEPARR
jgi:DNA-binding transcriptional LysR family regulator